MCDPPVSAIVDDDPEAWLTALPDWQRSDIEELKASGVGLDGLVERYLTVRSSTTTAPFGGMGPSFYRDKFSEEVFHFLCSRTRYQAERDQWAKATGLGKTSSVALLSESISHALGASPAFLAPAVAITLVTVGSLGLNAWYAAQAELRGNNDHGEGHEDAT